MVEASETEQLLLQKTYPNYTSHNEYVLKQIFIIFRVRFSKYSNEGFWGFGVLGFWNLLFGVWR